MALLEAEWRPVAAAAGAAAAQRDSIYIFVRHWGSLNEIMAIPIQLHGSFWVFKKNSVDLKFKNLDNFFATLSVRGQRHNKVTKFFITEFNKRRCLRATFK